MSKLGRLIEVNELAVVGAYEQNHGRRCPGGRPYS